MLSELQNETLTRIGPGTPMGELMRRYWHPIAASSELKEKPTKKIKLLSEDLVLYRDSSGNYGLMQERCPHRGVSLVHGIPEENGLRCQYHGWCFNHQGECTEQPNEPVDSTFKGRIRVKAYPVQELGGLLFAYLGPKPAPLLPNYDLFVKENVIRTIGYAVIPCNFLQIMENSFDGTHVEWLHGRYMEHVFEREGISKEGWKLSKHHVKLGFDLFDYGIIKRRVLEGQTEEDDDWKIGHPVVFPNILKIGGGSFSSFQIRVPMDDTHTYHIWYSCFEPGPNARIPEDYPISLYEVPFMKEDGNFMDDFISAQDILCWVTQGEIADRTTEHIGTTDKGIIYYRQILMKEIEKVKSGQDPMCVIRHPEKNRYIELPQEKDKYKTGEQWNLTQFHHHHNRYTPNLSEIIELVKGGLNVSN